MSQYNLGSLNSSGTAIKVVSAGDPETLILNHSTKNTVYIGSTNAVGSGNLLDATPLDPYASVVVTGSADVWAVAAVATQPAVVYTYQNAINWTPKAIQPNIIDSNSPWNPGGAGLINLNVPAGAQGLYIYSNLPAGGNEITSIKGNQSGFFYYLSPNSGGGTPEKFDNELWIPIMSDADSTVQVNASGSVSPGFGLVWIMNGFTSGLVASGQIADVNIASSTASPFGVSIPGTVTVSGNVNATEQSKQMFVNQPPVPIDVTIAAGSTSVLVAASAGVQLFVHTVRVENENASSPFYPQLQDTTGTVLANLTFEQEGGAIPAGEWGPIAGPNDFKGMPVALGAGLQLKNNGTVSSRYIGFLTYSK